MFHLIVFPHVTFFLAIIFVISLVLATICKNNKQEPWSLPILGHLHLLSGYEVPYQAFNALGKKYGPIIQLKLGSVKSLVVNGQENIREVLVTKGNHFDSRPDFQRYQMLFGGNKENSLAFSDWSTVQKARRDMLRTHTFPRGFTSKFNQLESIISNESSNLLAKIQPNQETEIKPLILQACFDIFTSHFCSKKFESNKKSLKTIEAFDDIFWEVNQGYAADFLPFLMPLHRSNMKRINGLAEYIRDFINEEIIGERYEKFNGEPTDYVESLIKSVKMNELDMDWNTALFALEDIVGGHSAVANFFVKVLGFIVNEKAVQKRIQEEIEEVLKNKENVTILDKNQMAYTEAVIFEAIRLIASPIVPRVANQDSCVKGVNIEKGTVIFLNNYDLSMSEELWEEPHLFKPERFIKDGRFVKPDHFLPFGGGRRSCMGYKLVILSSFGLLTSLLQSFNINGIKNIEYKVPVGSLAMPKKTFKFVFERR